MKKQKHISAYFLIFILMVSAVILPAGGCKDGKDKEDVPTVQVNPSEWEITSGEWEIKNNFIYQNAPERNTRFVYQNRINQDWTDLSLEVKLGDGETAGIEFRAAQQVSGAGRDKTSFFIGKNNKATVYNPTGPLLRGAYAKDFTVESKRWYKLNVILNGTSAGFYIDDKLIETRDDLAIKEGNEYIALNADGKGVAFKNITVDSVMPNNLTWDELLDASDLVKEGFDRFSAVHFEYPYIGHGRTSLLVGPYGFLSPKIRRDSMIGTNYRDDPQFIFDLWWDEAIKVDPFTFGGGYLVNGDVDTGELLDDGKCAYKQTIEIDSGKLVTELTLKVGGQYVNTVREMFVNESGVVLIKITGDSSRDFVFNMTSTNSKIYTGFTDLNYDIKSDGYVISSSLRKDRANKAYVHVKAQAETEITVKDNGDIVFAATDKPIYLYLSPSSDLSFESGWVKGTYPVAEAAANANAASAVGYNAEYKKMQDWYKDFYSVSKIEIPDLGMAKWYVRSLFYHAVSMAGTRVPPGCYANNVAGFFGAPCFEYDNMFSHLGLLYVNHPELTKTSTDWFQNTKATAKHLAENGYTDKTGKSLDPLVPGGYLFSWLSGWDGSPTRGVEVGHEQGWVSRFAGANMATAHIAQALYTGIGIDDAIDTLLGQGRVLMSSFIYNANQDMWVHKGVWNAANNTYPTGGLMESAAAVYTITAAIDFLQKHPEKFTSAEAAEINGWAEKLPKIAPYGNNMIGNPYDPDKGMKLYGQTLNNNTNDYITENTGFTGATNTKIFLWYRLRPYDDENLHGTLVSLAEGNGFKENGPFRYNFNAAWTATIAARAREADFAHQFTRYMLRPACLYDDWYFCENVQGSEDFKRAPELGAHGVYIMALSAMLFDGENSDHIKAFPAITGAWQKKGVSFERFLAMGQIEVSGKYTDEKTTVTLKNLSGAAIVRDIHVRVKEGSGAAMYNGIEYPITSGCMAVIPNVLVPAGGEKIIEVAGIEKDVQVGAFKALAPIVGSDRLRTYNIPFSWTRSDNAGSYELVIAEDSALQNTVFKKNVGSSTLYYPMNRLEQINLQTGKTYYWTVYGINGSNRAQLSQDVMTIKIK